MRRVIIGISCHEAKLLCQRHAFAIKPNSLNPGENKCLILRPWLLKYRHFYVVGRKMEVTSMYDMLRAEAFWRHDCYDI